MVSTKKSQGFWLAWKPIVWWLAHKTIEFLVRSFKTKCLVVCMQNHWIVGEPVQNQVFGGEHVQNHWVVCEPV